ncbi:hypothetical protein [Methylomagnum ishizawai]|uniref:hypothetical protein n=1 Tax=Methylomagnum ishizawai TaxID=1760988 RepID=UPI000F746FBE|nr:hypothetical protein [Methylomagnum ishizawai]
MKTGATWWPGAWIFDFQEEIVVIRRNALAFACAVGSLICVDAFAADVVCTQKALKGTYVYHLAGQEGGVPYAAAGMETFDGMGKGAVKETDSDGHQVQVTSTYTIDSDCTGEITYSSGDHNHIFVAPDGSSLTFVRDSEGTGTWYAGDEARVSRGRVKFIP